ncbi:hypothetical protein D3C84_863310 [compost metagenome]
MAAGHCIILVGAIAREGFAVEGHPVFGQQLLIAPATVPRHQQSDAGQVPSGEVGIGRGDEGARGVGFPDRSANAQGFEQRGPRIVRVALRTDDGFQRGGQQIGVATGITKRLPRCGVAAVIGGEGGHIAVTSGVEHGHH